MSHKSEIKTTLNNKSYLKKALEKLGFKYQEAKEKNGLKTKGHYSVHEEVDILLENNSQSVGFRLNEDGTYTAVGDFYSLKDEKGNYLDAKTLGCEVTAKSKQEEISDRLMDLGFTIDQSSTVENKDKIIMKLERWVP